MTEDLARLRLYIDDTVSNGETRLPAEGPLSDRLGVSRGRLRTMLKRLEDEGLIWRHVGKGTFVGPRQLSASAADWTASVSVDDVIAARLLIEPQLAAEAAMHATPADLAAMESCLAEMLDAPTLLQWKRLDDRLHRAIAEATHNMLLLLLYDTLRAQVKISLDARIETVFGRTRQPIEASDDGHRVLVAAIRQHDPAAAEQAMRAHLLSVRQQLFGLR